MHRKSHKFQINVEQELIRKYPELVKLPRFIEHENLNAFIQAVEKRPEGMKVKVENNMLRISPKKQIIHARLDFLGLEMPDEKLNDICDVIREETSRNEFPGTDPRKEFIYSKKGSVFENLHDNAMIEPNYLYPGKERKRHPLDRISSEEIVQRRALAERRWDTHSRKFKRKSRVSHDDKEIQNAVQYFFPKSKET